MGKLLSYRTRTPWVVLMKFSIPVFVVGLVLASLLLGVGFWAVFAASLVTIAGQVVIDAVWRRRHSSVLDLHD
jgi:uncharacterized membrane protein